MEGQPAVPPLANGWVLTREQDPPGEVVQRGLEAFRRRGIDTSLMEKIKQVGILKIPNKIFFFKKKSFLFYRVERTGACTSPLTDSQTASLQETDGMNNVFRT